MLIGWIDNCMDIQYFGVSTPLNNTNKETVMNTVVLVAAALVVGFAVGRIRSLAHFSRRPASLHPPD